VTLPPDFDISAGTTFSISFSELDARFAATITLLDDDFLAIA